MRNRFVLAVVPLVAIAFIVWWMHRDQDGARIATHENGSAKTPSASAPASPSTSSIAGHVTTPAGVAIAGAVVSITRAWRIEGTTTPWIATTDGAGTWRLDA
jgi:hypothetical protein